MTSSMSSASSAAAGTEARTKALAEGPEPVASLRGPFAVRPCDVRWGLPSLTEVGFLNINDTTP
jgi:hypothetical protein